jgi:NitT/TauT family transport system ATP-binding protein
VTDRAVAAPTRAGRVRFESVAKVYATSDGGLQALEGVDLDIEPGSIVSILGPSGCGKSTLLLLTAGLLPVTSGVITVNGERVTRPRTDVGVAFQQDLLLEWRNVLGNVLLPAEMRGLRRQDYEQHARELLDLVGLTGFETRHPAQLSGGMRQRVALVRALVMNLPILLLDEPFGALDAFTRDQLNVDFQHLWWTSRPTVLFVTHSIAEAVFLGDRVVVMTPRPARIELVVDIDLPRPRRLDVRASEEFIRYTKQLRDIFLKDGILREPDYDTSAAA